MDMDVVKEPVNDKTATEEDDASEGASSKATTKVVVQVVEATKQMIGVAEQVVD